MRMFTRTVSPPFRTSLFRSRMTCQRLPSPSSREAIRQRLSLSLTVYQVPFEAVTAGGVGNGWVGGVSGLPPARATGAVGVTVGITYGLPRYTMFPSPWSDALALISALRL